MIRNHSRSSLRAAALLASTALLVGAAALPAQATEVEEHCIALVDDGTVVCAETLEAADAEFTEATGYTRVEDAAARGDLELLVVYSLATLYQHAGYSGSSYTFTRSTACNGVTQAGISNLTSVGLNDAVSSFLTYGTCQVRLYADASYAGSTFGYASSQSSLPTFNDVASSARAR
jgi:hypothetical protein